VIRPPGHERLQRCERVEAVRPPLFDPKFENISRCQSAGALAGAPAGSTGSVTR
jgi:hypothetical protein